MNVAIITFDVGNDVFKLVKTSRLKFLKDCEKKFFIFTESKGELKESLDNELSDVKIIKKIKYNENLYSTTKYPIKYYMIDSYSKLFKDYDYIFYISDDIIIHKEIDSTLILGKDLIALLHPGFVGKSRKKYTYEFDKKSVAYVSSDEGTNYYYDSIVGGSRESFLKLSHVLSHYYLQDNRRKVFPLWGDESYLNRYFIDVVPDFLFSSDIFTIPTEKKAKSVSIKVQNRIDLTDLTFMIPVKIDNDHRLENLKIILDYLNYNFNTNIMLAEESEYPTLQNFSEICNYTYYKPSLSCFHRMKLLNLMAKRAKTPFVSNYDCDILLTVDSYVQAMNLLRKGKFDMMYPFKYNVRVPRDVLPLIQATLDVSKVNIQDPWVVPKIGYGCCNIIDREKYIKCGMENENFRSWGPEDYERYERFKKLGLRIGRLDKSYSYHIEHSRGPDSGKTNVFYEKNVEEYDKIKSMSKEQLIKYILKWKWVRDLIPRKI